MKAEKQRIKCKWIDGDIYLSVSTLKQIMTSDQVVFLETKTEGKPIPTSLEYIKDFINRIENIPFVPDRKWWEMF